MTNTLIFSLSFLFFGAGLAFFYSPRWILWANRLAREWIFNDNYVVLDRNKRAVFCLLLAFFFSYWGYQREQDARRPVSPYLSTDRLLYQSLQCLHAKKYSEAREICQGILARDRDNAEALYQLGAAEYLMKNVIEGRALWQRAVQSDPHCPKASHLRNLVLRDKAADLPDPGFEVP